MRLALLLALGAVGSVAAQTIDLVPPELVVPPGQTRLVTFGTVPQRDTTVTLEIGGRLDTPRLGGSSFFMDLTLNGQPVRAARSRGAVRLTNRPLVSPVAPNLPAPWYGQVGGWRILYAPDFDLARKESYYVGDPHTLVLDVTDLTNPAAENKLEIRNNASAATAKRLQATLNLVVGRLRVVARPGASPMMAADDLPRHRVTRGEPAAGSAAYQGEVLPGGGVALTVAGRRWLCSSAWSYPNAGFNRFAAGPPDAAGQPGWRCDVRANATGAEVAGTSPDYRVSRQVQFTARKVVVRDRITNAHADRKLGLAVRHEVSLAGAVSPAVRLAGNGDPAVDRNHAPANPTVHLGSGDHGLGLVAEDDILRNQASLFVDSQAKIAGLETTMLCLQPGGSQTLEWSIYPVASPEYYDFINLVRQDWGSNFTIEGAWCFFGPDDIINMPADRLAERLDRLAVRYACSWGGWVDAKHDRKRIGFGTEVASGYWADYRRRLKEATAKLHQVRPGLKVLIYYDSQRDTYDDAGTRYADSRLTDARGLHGVTDWSGIYSRTWSMVATLDNQFGRGMLDLVDVYMDQIGADGLYWDEMENVAYGAPLLSFAQPDGRSAILDPKTWTIQQECGVTTLLGESHRLAVIDKVRRKGGTLMGNGPAATRAILGRRVQRMVEIQHNDTWCYEGHLGTLLGYASSPKEFANVRRALGMAMLLVGVRLDYDYEVNRYLYPLTPIEIQSGYLLGRERIVTMHSGSYGWPGRETVPCTVQRFNGQGKLTSSTPAVAGPGAQRVKLDLVADEIAVIERAAR